MWWRNLFLDPFLKNQNWAYFLINSHTGSCSLFLLCMPCWGLLNYIETNLQITYICLIVRFFIKEKVLELVSLPHCQHEFWSKTFFLPYCINWPISLSGCLYFVRYWAQYVYCNCLLTRFWRQKFWNKRF